MENQFKEKQRQLQEQEAKLANTELELKRKVSCCAVQQQVHVSTDVTQQEDVERKLQKLNQKTTEKIGKEAQAEDDKKKILEQKKEEIAKHFEEQAAQAQQLIQQQALLAQQQQVEQLKGTNGDYHATISFR